jgi:ABC-type nitrate/sulfonate/bicarbonate transport system substrate-binding protein
MRHCIRLILTTTIALALSAQLAVADDVLKLAVGQRGKWDGAVPDLGQLAGIFKKHGIRLEILYTSGGGETMQAVISGSVDMGMNAGTYGVLGAFAKGAPIRIVGAQATGDDAYWYVRADSSIKTMADMAGKTMAYSTTGSSTHSNVLALVDHFKVQAKPTATGGPAPTFTQVMSGQIDAGWSAPPFGIEALRKGEIRVIARSNDLPAVRGHTIRVNTANAQSLAAKPAVYARYMRAHRETIEWMYASDEALKVYADYAGVSVDVAKQIREEFDPKDMVQPDRILGLADLMAEAVRFKYIPQPLTEAQLKELIRIP